MLGSAYSLETREESRVYSTHHVQSPKLDNGRSDEILDVGLLRNIPEDGDTKSPHGVYLHDKRLECCRLRREIIDNDGEALARETQSNSPPYSACGSGNDCDS